MDKLTEDELELWLTTVNNQNPDLGEAPAKLREHHVDGSQLFNHCEGNNLFKKYKLTTVEANRIQTLRKRGRRIVSTSIATLTSPQGREGNTH